MNGESDCTQSKVLNPNFATDINNWTTSSLVSAVWTATGAQGAMTGAIYANNVAFAPGLTSTVIVGPEQCIGGSPGNYKVYAEAFIASADVPPAGPAAVSVNLLFYGTADCSATLLSSFQTAVSSAKDVWTLLQGIAVAPAGTMSIKVRLGLIKSIGQPSFKATFDNILVAPSP
jgi:hypothetical protein